MVVMVMVVAMVVVVVVAVAVAVTVVAVAVRAAHHTGAGDGAHLVVCQVTVRRIRDVQQARPVVTPTRYTPPAPGH